MIVLNSVVSALDAVSLVASTGAREKLIESTHETLCRIQAEFVEVGTDERGWFLLVKAGDSFGVSKRVCKDEFDFARGFTIALLRALGLKK